MRRKWKKARLALRWADVVLLLVVCTAVYSWGCGGGSWTLPGGGRVAGESYGLDAETMDRLDGEIESARTAYLDEYHYDLAPMIELLEAHVGDLETTSYICERMGRRASFCWTWASQLNPEHRDELCTRMVEDIGGDYERQCRDGQGRFVY